MTRLLSALINGGLLSGLLVLLVWLVLRFVPRRLWNAATRYAVWWAVLGITVALPALYLPRTEPAPARLRRSAGVSLAAPGPTPSLRDLAITSLQSVPVHAAAQHPVWSIEIAADTYLRGLFFAWAAVSGLLLARVMLSCVLLSRTSRRAVEVAELLPRASARRLRVAVSPDLASPVAVGLLRPSVLIPAALAEQLDRAELEQVVAHEAAHLARYDDWALLAQRLIEAMFALHPVVRWITRRIDLEREMACDDLVVAATGRPRSYANCLTRVVEFGGYVRPSLLAAGAANDGSHLARRVDMLLDKTRHTGTKLLKTRFAAVVAAVAALAWVAGSEGGFVAFAAPLARTVRAIPKLISLPVLASPAVQEPRQPTRPAFQGQVIDDATGDPLRSAEVRLQKAGTRELIADLDSGRDGTMHATSLPPGDYKVEVSKPNYITAALQFRIPGDPLTVRLVRYGVISGRVTDQQGKPLPGVLHAPGGRAIGGTRVVVLAKTAAGEPLRSVRETSLQDDGTYRIYDLTPGQYALGLWYDGLKEGSGVQLYPDNARPRLFTVAGGEEYPDIDFLVLPQGAYRVSGKVEGARKSNRYALSLALPEQPALPIAQTVTGDDGSFQFERIRPGVYDLLAGGPDVGYGARTSFVGPNASFARSRINVSGDVENLVIEAKPARSVSVKLAGQGGEGIPKGCEASVSIVPNSLEPWGIEFRNGSVVASGNEATLRNLAPGRFRLVAAGLGSGCYQANEAIADLSGEQAAPVTIELASAGQIRGSLRTAARPADFVVVLLDTSDAAADAQTRIAFPDAAGHFEFEGLHPGGYRIAAQSAAEARARWVADVGRMTSVAVKGGAAAEVELSVPAKGGRQ
jgi:beta-lactamase regulating signal transducer with metallopeptidase domain